ncbi:heterokaryon incompatibility protein-domain-containing protein [Podospora fimiseda]|uniref:Heterokaryon incompatibility protein-domain-containing protein n=1 Tax=Podospora fimiseda TaxID=252190 RepID=A0AAN7BEY8_9PEZI|nr:heterokaryon incompatibility protein-domain-containing protein [Podospora fimiseda]
MQKFFYLPLKHDIREIRLLTLNYPDPGSGEGSRGSDSSLLPSINLTLFHAALDAQPTHVFSALSYVWGEANNNRSIILDGQTFQVTNNLFTALTRLYTDSFNGHIWIDAICINQSDNDEKAVQVQLMSHIYTRAAKVLIWLGPEPDHGALQSIQYLGTMFREQVRSRDGIGEIEFNNRASGFVQTVRQFAVTDGYGDSSKPDFNFELLWLFFSQRPWWRRVWIIQEVVLARQATILCGTASIPWDDLAECLAVFEWMILYPSIEPQHKRLYHIVGAIIQSVMHLLLANSGYQRSLKGAAGDVEKAGMSLLETLNWTFLNSDHDSGIQATNPRDRIYGLLGIVRPEDVQKITVDYSDNWSLDKILFEVGKILLKDHGPDVLTYYQGPLMHKCHENPPPSWVIDWTAPRTLIVPGISLENEHHNKYNASRGTSWEYWSSKCLVEQASYEQPQISLRGRIVAQITAVGQEFVTLPGSPGFLGAARTWLLEIESMVETYRVSSSDLNVHTNDDVLLSSSGSALSNVWRVPICDMGLIQRADDEHSARYLHGFELLTGKRQPAPEMVSEGERVAWIMAETWDFRRVWKVYGRRAFVDSAGRPGNSIKNAQVADQVVIFAGGHVPFIIRPTADKGSDFRYRFVGSAYVFGLMDGEGMEGEQNLEEIRLI